jgi:DNA-binding response OmpR family regulator
MSWDLRRTTIVNMRQRILVVDDEPSVHDVARGYLEREGYEVVSAMSGIDGLVMAQTMEPAVVVLDRMLPDMTGEELCVAVRRASDVAIVMLSAKASEGDRIHGLELGADDYLVKPFSPRELVARVAALLRRTRPLQAVATATPDVSIDDGRLRVDVERHQAVVDGAPVDLTPCEYRLLMALAQTPGRVYSRFELINRVQGYDYEGYERTIDAHVKNLRRKIESDPGKPRYIVTVHGVGYRLADKAA